MDFNKANCTLQLRTRCAAAAPNVHKLIDAARAQHVPVIHATTTAIKLGDIVEALAPLPEETALKSKSITTVIEAGSTGNGAVLLTTIGGVSRGFNMVVRVDTMPAEMACHEQFAIFEIADVTFLHAHATLTRSDMVKL